MEALLGEINDGCWMTGSGLGIRDVWCSGIGVSFRRLKIATPSARTTTLGGGPTAGSGYENPFTKTRQNDDLK